MFNTFKLYTKKEIPIDKVVEELVALGYKRVDTVYEEGDFSLRGDILEVFPVNFSYPLRVEWNFDLVDKIYSYDRILYKKIIDYDFLIVIPHFPAYGGKKSKRYTSENLPIEAVLKIKKGDYVVHSEYGIGCFLGVKELIVREKKEHFFAVEYQNKDIIYVAKEEAHLIQKYINFSNKPPKLSRLGTKEWIKVKERVGQGIKNFALEFLRMQAQRNVIGGFKYSSDGEWQKSFEAGFPYQETQDQIKAVDDVKKDMESDLCMDRIICGDVGYGKTEVAMRAAFKAVLDGRQVAFLVPTTILAYQHYTNLVKRLRDFPFRVQMLSRFRTPREQKNIVADLEKGKVDIVVGTHRMLSKDIVFKDLGLLIIDEEHKFGVVHKERIKKMRVGIDVLILTATPIPRTLYMSLIGIKDISVIKTPPKDRLAVKTEIVEFSSKMLAKIIMQEIARKGQVFVIHNRIESIEKIGNMIKKDLSKDVRMGMIHGRLAHATIEKVMLDFIEGRVDCLISTAIVESGIDIPQANTIIINNAHMFGLADLHQLRGRVGRFNVQAFAYLVTPRIENISTESKHRLEMIKEFSHLGAGFEVAMSDLELRGAGNILGQEQHGFVWMVGFDLYCRLLKKEIDYLTQIFH